MLGKNRIHYTQSCRALYATCRKNGSPAVIIHKISHDVFIGEVRGDSTPHQVSGCCRWAMKFSLAKDLQKLS